MGDENLCWRIENERGEVRGLSLDPEFELARLPPGYRIGVGKVPEVLAEIAALFPTAQPASIEPAKCKLCCHTEHEPGQCEPCRGGVGSDGWSVLPCAGPVEQPAAKDGGK